MKITFIALHECRITRLNSLVLVLSKLYYPKYLCVKHMIHSDRGNIRKFYITLFDKKSLYNTNVVEIYS